MKPAKNLTATLGPVVAKASFLLSAEKIDSLVFSSAQTAASPEAPHCSKPIAYEFPSTSMALTG